ncbi:MAG: histidine phosphatase family protein [Actinomycetales bacterium]
MHPARLWVVRHGNTQWSTQMLHTGRTDVPLSPEGEQAARRLAPLIATLEPALVLCSPLQRAQQTATLAGLTSYELEPAAMEWDYGAWEGRRTVDIRAELAEPTWVIWDHPVPPGNTAGEQLDQVAERATMVINRCLPVLQTGQDCLLVAHGQFLRILAATWLGMPPIFGRHLALDPAHVGTLGWEHCCPVIRSWNLLN